MMSLAQLQQVQLRRLTQLQFAQFSAQLRRLVQRQFAQLAQQVQLPRLLQLQLAQLAQLRQRLMQLVWLVLHLLLPVKSASRLGLFFYFIFIGLFVKFDFIMFITVRLF
jgi:hypothetical protein